VRPWGFWTTVGWALLAFLVGQFGALGGLLVLHGGDLNAVLAAQFDGVQVTLSIYIANPLTVAVIALAVWIKRASQVDYLALKLPPARHLAAALAWLVGLIVVGDVLLYLTGQALVTSFQLESYGTAAAEGWLPELLVGAIVVAPAGEEILFRGFLFRGWARSKWAVWPAIVGISLLWAVLHLQYDWTGMLEIFIIGLFLGAVRWRSGSTVLTFLLHALFNLEGSIETLLQMRTLS
jgi:uncharacterized protein